MMLKLFVPVLHTQVPSIRKLYNGSLMDIPQGNAGSAILRFEEFMKVVPSYEQVCLSHTASLI